MIVNINRYLKLFLVAFFILSFFQIRAKKVVVFSDPSELLNIDASFFVYEDKTDSITFEEAIIKQYLPINQSVPNLGISRSTFWIKLNIYNKSDSEKLILKLDAPQIDKIEFFYPNQQNQYESIISGESQPFNNRKYHDPNFLFDLSINNKSLKTYYFKISSAEDIVLPFSMGTKDVILEQTKLVDLISGIYIGIMLVMLLYNLFIYFSVKDKSYLYYVSYILLVLLVQTGFQGYFFQYAWPNSPDFSQYSVFLFSSLVGIAGMMFMNVFLKVKLYYKNLYLITYILSAIYLFPIILPLIGFETVAWKLLSANAGLVSFYMLFVSIMIVRKGYPPAKYFVAAWSIFLLGVMGFVLKNVGVLPFNNFTRYTMQIGSAIETILLSFALAARINIYKKERLDALEEKEKIVREQNVMLEKEVKERTSELNRTLTNLKEAQSQLVDSEKMSSLGQLTAGIAHEINNPINFVSSNISPLRRDFEDINTVINKYEELKSDDNNEEKFAEIERLKNELDFEYLKTEIPGIINGIEDGANRTKEIVRGLRNFSHLDEADQQKVDINVGVESTLILIKTKLNNISLKTELGTLPITECYPSKLNQVFMNIIDNAVSAINSKSYIDEKPEILIKTYTESNSIVFRVEDNGVGMAESTQEKMFEPFFTTKDVGQGTGLGLSIAYGIIEKHLGKIEVESTLNKGTVVTVKIPIKV